MWVQACEGPRSRAQKCRTGLLGSPPNHPRYPLESRKGQATQRGKTAARHERSIWGEAVTFWEREAESLRPQGTWQHLNLGQEGPWQHDTQRQAGPAACSPQPRALTPTDNWWARRWGLEGSRTGRQARVTPCGRCLPQTPPNLSFTIIAGCPSPRLFKYSERGVGSL